MLNTYIKNRGTTQTIVYDNNNHHIDEINWDADYDGNIANLSLMTNTDGKREGFNITLDNKDLAEILNYPSVNIPIHKRLEFDYIKPNHKTINSLLYEKTINQLNPNNQINEEIIIPIKFKRNYMRSKKHRRHKSNTIYRKNKRHRSKTSKKYSF
jgi:hypothetical protein